LEDDSEWSIEKNLEGSGCDIVRLLSQNFPGETEGNQVKTHSSLMVSRLRTVHKTLLLTIGLTWENCIGLFFNIAAFLDFIHS
jgi:hypothetical protein